jgi:hypothetical protein
MRYQLDFDPGVREYLDALPLTREGRLRLYVSIHLELSVVSDGFRAQADRASPDSPCFAWQLIFRDGGRFRFAYFSVDDSGAAYGVLRIVYADCP